MYYPVQLDPVSAQVSVLGAEAAEYSIITHLGKKKDDKLDGSFSFPENPPAVRLKTGNQVQFPLFTTGSDKSHSGHVLHPRPSSDTWPQLPHHTSFPSGMPFTTPYVIPSALSPVSTQLAQLKVPSPLYLSLACTLHNALRPT